MPPRRRDDSDDDDDDDDDQEELKAIRAARGLKVSSGPPDDEDAFVSKPSRPAARQERAPVHEEMDEVEQGAADDDMRLMFPMNFGQTSSGRKAEGKELQNIHAQNKRNPVKGPQIPSSSGGGEREALEAMLREAKAVATSSAQKPAAGDAEVSAKAADDGQMEDSIRNDQQGDEDDNDDDDDQSDSDEDSGMGGLVPCSHEALLKGHTKPVNALAVDPAGARIITGGADCTVRMWDFNGMDSSLKNFREITPWDGQHVKSLQFSITGDKILIATSKNQCALYTRDGSKEVEFMKGDMYVHDMAQTKGHVAALVTARFHPENKNTCMTASIDG
jgi:hypothetical protein